jgi:hypothetical protein
VRVKRARQDAASVRREAQEALRTAAHEQKCVRSPAVSLGTNSAWVVSSAIACRWCVVVRGCGDFTLDGGASLDLTTPPRAWCRFVSCHRHRFSGTCRGCTRRAIGPSSSTRRCLPRSSPRRRTARRTARARAAGWYAAAAGLLHRSLFRARREPLLRLSCRFEVCSDVAGR